MFLFVFFFLAWPQWRAHHIFFWSKNEIQLKFNQFLRHFRGKEPTCEPTLMARSGEKKKHFVLQKYIVFLCVFFPPVFCSVYYFNSENRILMVVCMHSYIYVKARAKNLIQNFVENILWLQFIWKIPLNCSKFSNKLNLRRMHSIRNTPFSRSHSFAHCLFTTIPQYLELMVKNIVQHTNPN